MLCASPCPIVVVALTGNWERVWAICTCWGWSEAVVRLRWWREKQQLGASLSSPRPGGCATLTRGGAQTHTFLELWILTGQFYILIFQWSQKVFSGWRMDKYLGEWRCKTPGWCPPVAVMCGPGIGSLGGGSSECGGELGQGRGHYALHGASASSHLVRRYCLGLLL